MSYWMQMYKEREIYTKNTLRLRRVRKKFSIMSRTKLCVGL